MKCLLCNLDHETRLNEITPDTVADLLFFLTVHHGPMVAALGADLSTQAAREDRLVRESRRAASAPRGSRART